MLPPLDEAGATRLFRTPPLSLISLKLFECDVSGVVTGICSPWVGHPYFCGPDPFQDASLLISLKGCALRRERKPTSHSSIICICRPLPALLIISGSLLTAKHSGHRRWESVLCPGAPREQFSVQFWRPVCSEEPQPVRDLPASGPWAGFEGSGSHTMRGRIEGTGDVQQRKEKTQ